MYGITLSSTANLDLHTGLYPSHAFPHHISFFFDHECNELDTKLAESHEYVSPFFTYKSSKDTKNTEYFLSLHVIHSANSALKYILRKILKASPIMTNDTSLISIKPNNTN